VGTEGAPEFMVGVVDSKEHSRVAPSTGAVGVNKAATDNHSQLPDVTKVARAYSSHMGISAFGYPASDFSTLSADTRFTKGARQRRRLYKPSNHRVLQRATHIFPLAAALQKSPKVGLQFRTAVGSLNRLDVNQPAKVVVEKHYFVTPHLPPTSPT